MPTPWLDQLLAVPLIGIRWDPPLFFSEHEYLQKARPLFAGFPDEEKWTIDGKGLGSYRVECGNFTLVTTPQDTTVEYTYRVKVTPGRGAIPEVKFGKLTPFSALLEEVTRRTKLFVHALPFLNEARVLRIGVVASCRIEADDLPPGVSAFLRFLGQPWGRAPEEGLVNIKVDLEKSETATDRCNHQLNLPEIVEPRVPDDENRVIDFRIDWQRYFKEPLKLSPKDFDTHLAAAVTAAVGYFQKFGRGDLTYAGSDSQ